MARGWESKSIEAQQIDHEQRQQDRQVLTPIDPALAARRRTLELSRARAAADLVAATNPAHRRMLETALRALDAELEIAR